MKIRQLVNKLLGRTPKNYVSPEVLEQSFEFQGGQFAVLGKQTKLKSSEHDEVQAALDKIGEGLGTVLGHDDENIRNMGFEALIAIFAGTFGPMVRDPDDVRCLMEKVQLSLESARDAYAAAKTESGYRKKNEDERPTRLH